MVPSRLALQRAERVNARLGHENLGFLSTADGFLPRRPPRWSLPPAFAAWDAVAADLPYLYRTLTLRPVLDALPVLPAHSGALPDEDLLRAATVLGVLAHAYQYVSVRAPERLPASVAAPWAEVLGRLGRRQPVLSYIDLIVHNWRLTDPSVAPAVRVANLRLLVPTVDTVEERVFYLTQTEILARCTPIVPAVVAAQEAVEARDPDGVDEALVVVRDTLASVTRESLPLIDPVATGATHVDAVVWARTVAPFAVPFVAGVLGPSATSSPIVSLLDVFLERARHDGVVGREIAGLRTTFPLNWRVFLSAVGETSVPAAVGRHGGPATRAVLHEVLDAYAGERGFLGRHRRKVLGYLDIAFKVGRGVSISGFRGGFADRPWERIDDELDRSRRERWPVARQSVADAAALAASPVDRRIPLSELVRHDGGAAGCWLAVDGDVHDVTDFVHRHPGGHRLLEAYAGTDASGAFHRVHGDDRAVTLRRERLVIGCVDLPHLTSDEAREAWTTWSGLLLTVVEMSNAHRHDAALQRCVTTAGEAADAVTPYKLERAAETFERFLTTYVDAVVGTFIPALAATIDVAVPPPRRVGVPAIDATTLTPAGVRHLDDLATTFLAAVKEGLRAGVLVFEIQGAAALAGDRTELRAALDAVAAGVADLRAVLDP